MTLLQSIILGIIQGLTEFIPISSSAHLVITPYLLRWHIPTQEGFIFDILVQLGTLLAVIIYFRKELYQIIASMISGLLRRHPLQDPMARLGWLLVLATIPALIAGLLFKDQLEAVFSSPQAAVGFLVGTAILLVIAELAGRRSRTLETVTWLDALIVGVFQVISLFPGISRSGSTIAGGMLRNFDRPAAARFSFLMSVPVMIGAGALAVVDLFQAPNFGSQLPTLIVGFIVAAIVGFLAIRWLLSYLSRSSLYIFSIYCLAAALFTSVFFIIRS